MSEKIQPVQSTAKENKYTNSKTLIKLFVFEEEIKQKIKLPYIISGGPGKIDYDVMFIKKNILNKYKQFFDYKTLYNHLKTENPKVLNCITENNILKYQKLNKENLSHIIEQLPKDLIEKIENMNKKELINEIKKEDGKYFHFDYYISKRDQKEFFTQYLTDFRIINYDIFISMKSQNINFKSCVYADCIFGDEILFFVFKDKNGFYFEIGFFDEMNEFHAEYLFNKNEIVDAKIFLQNLSKIGVKNIMKNLNKNEEVNHVLVGDKKFACFKIGVTNLKGRFLIKIGPKIKTNNNQGEILDKIKALILLSIYLNKTKNLYTTKKFIKENIEDIFLLNKHFLSKYFYNTIDKLVSQNEQIQKIINNIILDELSLNSINEIITKIDSNKLKEISNRISEVKNNDNYPFNAYKRVIPLPDKKCLKFYIEYIIISKKILFILADAFKFKFETQNFHFDLINDSEILKFNSNNKINYGLFICTDLTKNETETKIENKEKMANEEMNNNACANKILELIKKLDEKENELKELKSKLPFEISKEEKLMNIIIKSEDQNILIPLLCKNTDLFVRVESEIYKIEDFKEYKEKDNFFLVNGHKVNKYDTLEKNGIKNNDIVILVTIDDDE